MIRDVAVRVQEPEDFLAETIFPSHIVVPRCQGELKEISMYSGTLLVGQDSFNDNI